MCICLLMNLHRFTLDINLRIKVLGLNEIIYIIYKILYIIYFLVLKNIYNYICIYKTTYYIYLSISPVSSSQWLGSLITHQKFTRGYNSLSSTLIFDNFIILSFLELNYLLFKIVFFVIESYRTWPYFCRVWDFYMFGVFFSPIVHY